MVNISISLAGIRLFTLSSHDSEFLTKRAVLQASPGIVECIKRLLLARRMNMRGRNTIDCSLEDRNKVFFEIRIRYLGRGSDGDRGGERTGCGDGELSYKGGRCVYIDGVHG